MKVGARLSDPIPEFGNEWDKLKLRLGDLDVVKLLRADRSGVGDGALLARVADDAAGERRPRRGVEIGLEGDGVGAASSFRR